MRTLAERIHAFLLMSGNSFSVHEVAKALGETCERVERTVKVMALNGEVMFEQPKPIYLKFFDTSAASSQQTYYYSIYDNTSTKKEL